MRKVFVFIFAGCFMGACSTYEEGTEDYAEYFGGELRTALRDSSETKVADSIAITTYEQAVAFAEPILFSTYGEENIKKQRPYVINKIDHYYVIGGALKNNVMKILFREEGGSFLIILNADNGHVVSITHGK